MHRSKTNTQLGRIFGLARKIEWGKDELEALAWEVSNGRVERLSCLSFDEANEMIVRLGGDPFLTAVRSRRTVNHHRQRAGVPQIATAAQLQFMRDLADRRGITEDGLDRLCRRMLKKGRPRTTSEANKIIEAIKAMNKRDALQPVAAAGSSAGRAA